MGEDAGLPAHRQQAVHVIRRGGEHLLSLIEGTLDIARIESGKLTLDVAPMRFADGLHEMAALFELQAAAKGLAFQFEAQSVIPDVVRVDERRLRQILINLLGNAIKFTAQGQVTLRVRHASEMARIEVQDTGPGLDAGELECIFEPFARGSSSGSGAAPGAGLGLTIARMLTEVMGGELTVSSTPGAGSVFRIKLFVPEVHGPAAAAAPSLAPARARQAAQRHGYAGERRRILLVDNEEADRELLAQWLAPRGFELRQAASGHDALELLAGGYRPHALFMDLAMPGIDGWETLRRVQQLPGPMPHCAVVSANAFDKALDNDVGIRPQDFFVKPVRHSELLDWLEQRLGLQWLAPEGAAAPGALADSAGWASARAAGQPSVSAVLRSCPDAATCAALARNLSLGYYRGILLALDELERNQPAHAVFVAQMRALAAQFQFEAMGRVLEQAVRS
jgi:CheY-like chemotaxis protein/anti-sigma regulatory factor (Ser/Thr protein kinase)